MKYTIWQRPASDPFCFKHKQPDEIKLDDFCSVWTSEVQDDDQYAILEEIFTQFNISHPAHYAGRSLSVGDLVQLGNEFYLCEMIGWKKVEVKD